MFYVNHKKRIYPQNSIHANFKTPVKERAKELKHLKGAVMKGVKVVGDSCKKAWNKVKSIKH
uniref:Uncharacterized protein n=1 Tax=Oryza nivara TaxID=4536 RepID=A0A0E0H3G4_ORYNI